jgi:small nuclear ribonucleoprotein (snRNP)-like protein
MADNVDVTANSEFFYSNVRSVTTNFNVSPYYDDYDGTSNYYKILFKPGYAVQARELTQIQSILQEQINRFGQHIFKEGSMVLGGKYNIDTRAHYVKVKDFDLFDNKVNIDNFKNEIVTGQLTGIKAYVNLVIDGSEGTDTPKTLYVTYMSGNSDTDEVVFVADEPLVSNVGTLIVGNTVPVGYGSVFTVNEGIRFAKEHFIYHNKQSVVVDRYDIFPTCKVGFVLDETIINPSQDSSLLDPALEASNYAAPGADRFKIIPTLTRLDIDDEAGFPNYVNLFTIDKGNVTELNERPVYNVIADEIAKRTYDESGDYYVRGFNTVIEEHLDLGNGGYLIESRGGDSQLLSIQVEPGTAYVKGYEVNKLVTEFLTTEKATSFANVNGQIISSKVGSYIIANNVVGAWNVNIGQNIDLYDTAQKRVFLGTASTASQTGKKIGTARIKSLSKEGGKLGSPDGAIRIHLFDVNMLGSNSFSSVKSVYYNNLTTADMGADVVLESGSAKIADVYSPLLYYVGSNYTKTIRSPDGTVDTSFFFKRTTDVSIDSSGAFSLTSPIASENFPYGTTTLSASDLDDIFLNLNLDSPITIDIGTASSGAGTTVLRTSGTGFSTLNIGDKITLSGNGKIYVVSSIANNNTLTVTQTLPSSVSAANTIYKTFLNGDTIELTGAGTGGSRSVSATPLALNFNIAENFGTSVTGTVTYTMYKSNAREIRKVLRRNRYVLIDCSTAGTSGSYYLGYSDIYAVKSVRKATSFTAVTDGDDVGLRTTIDRGQRDNYYGTGKLFYNGTLTASDKLLVCLDYFEPDYTLGVGYFSIDSYPIDDTVPSADQIRTQDISFYISKDTGKTYDLRNHLDFRPVFTNTAGDATTIDQVLNNVANKNPPQSTTLRYEANGLRIPADSESIIYDYSYYLARKDIVTLNKKGDFMIIKGVPASVPITPACPQHLMSIAKLFIPPYPSLSPSYGRLIQRIDLAAHSERTSQVRFTMKDIGVLKQRVDNLENYVSLSLLEKSALDMKILDENGLDRFKNGIFVDSFTSFALSDYNNPDHHICYDPKEGSIRPLFNSHGLGYKYFSGSNIVVENNLLMLPYTEVMALTQPYATTTRNVETTVYRFIGKLFLDPDSDYWVNTDRLASQTFNFGATDADVTPYSIVYASWQTTVTGVTTTDPVLISSATALSSTSQTIGGGPAGEQSIAAFYQGTDILDNIGSLIDTYGADTPVTWTTWVDGYATNHNATLGDFYPVGRYFGIAGEATTATNLYQQIGPTIGQYAGIISPADKLWILQNPGTIDVTTTTTTATTTNTYQTTATTGTQATRNYKETFQTLKTESHSIGDKVTAVAPIADIRPQTIAFEGAGLKASTRYYVYFDGQLMSAYVTPGIASSIPSSLGNNKFKNLITATDVEGGKLYSDANGYVHGFLRLPVNATKTFRTGTKEVILTDSPTNEPDATAAAKGYFVAQGITQTIQETIISTGQVITTEKSGTESQPIRYSTTTNTYSTVTSTTDVVVANNSIPGSLTFNYIDNPSCMAYSFKLTTPNAEEGTFLSSIDVFFAEKDPNLGVWFEIRAMDNGGTITKTQVPGSEVWLQSNQVNTSDNGSVATNIKFKDPVFLMNNQEYAFIIHTVGINPNYYMYVCVLGQADIITNQKINNRPLTGTLFTTNNNTDWDIVPRVDLKITFNRAKFSTDVVGEAIIGNKRNEYVQLPLTQATGSNTAWFGDRIRGNDKLQLQAPTGPISVGDYLIGQVSSTNTAVKAIDGSTYSMSGTGYVQNENISVRRANGSLATGVTSSVVSTNTATGAIYKVTPKNDITAFNGNSAILIVEDSNGLFEANDTLHMELTGSTVFVNKVTKMRYSSIQFEPSYLDFIPTDISFSMLTTSNSGSVGEYQSIVVSNPMDFDDEKALYSHSAEIANFGGAPSNRVKIRMTTTSDYLTPIVNLDRTYSVYIDNLINSNTSGELSSSGGGLKDKYLSQVVTLADGQDAEDLRVVLTAYRPPGSNSDIKVYARISNAEDFESIKSRNWFELTPYDSSVYSSLTNRKNWREFQYKIPDSLMTGSNDQDDPIVRYTNSANTVFEGFKQFQIKIGLVSDNSAIYPRATDLRVIALQK